jgi:cephalosporin-C deacetylase-like acetyl esterase
MKSICRILTGLLLLATAAAAQNAEALDFLAGHTDFRTIRTMLPEHVKRRAFELLAARRQTTAAITSAAGIAERKRFLRERMTRALGGFPERTPLNARVTGVLDRGDYTIEKIVFESQPRFYVTANLYLPKRGQPPYPAVLYPLGHESGAKANPVWQQMLGSLAKKGFAALTWDTLGQGERIQIYDEDLRTWKLVRSTTEHTIVGAQCLLTGDNVARYTVWDGMRALDYLLSRKEVDGTRIACSGNSGGGTHTAYLTALDDRIHVAAPSCYLTTWGRLLATIGPQDAEQCLPPWIADGLDHADFVYAAAPRPYLILSAIRDFFSITGARETYRESKRIYDLLGAGEKLEMVEADDGHGFTKPRRLAAYDWFGRWLRGARDTEAEPEVMIATEEELYATPTGQVATSLGGETVMSLNRKRAAQLRRPEKLSVDLVRQAIGIPLASGTVIVRPFGTIERAGYTIEKLVYESEAGISIPALLLAPEAGGRKAAVVFVNGRGKAAARREMEALAEGGLVVLSIDARGFGETRSTSGDGASDWSRRLGDYESAMTALLTGTTLVGMRALDVMRAVDLLSARPDVDPARISAIGREGGAIPTLHAAVLDARIRKVALDGMLASYDLVVHRNVHAGVFEHVIPGVLKSYDLADLVAALGPREALIADAADPLGTPLTEAEARAQFGRAGRGARVVRRRPEENPLAAYRGFIAGTPR